MTDTILSHLTYLYGEEAGRQAYDRLGQIMAEYRSLLPPPTPQTLDQRSSVLITYGDMVHEPGSSPKDPPLVALNALLHRHLVGAIDTVHLLPFYPYSSDDGFSVIDYRAVDPALGSWEDITAIGRDFRLMFDAVVNHISAESDWFQAFLRDEAPYDTYFVTVPEGVDVSQVFRPRARPLLTRFATARGVERVWTTFSEDQIDLNFANPEVLLEVMDLLLFYIQKGQPSSAWMPLLSYGRSRTRHVSTCPRRTASFSYSDPCWMKSPPM
ncbi:MAG: alpha-amylase family glycosyl hydrolase [Chloroflexota bacterium]